jgi:3-oxoacyl-[acyl-carrier-protein] synthase III
MNIRTRHICRDLRERCESPRPEHTNATLASDALSQALAVADMKSNDLSYLLVHTATPGQLVPPNISRVAELLG